MAEVATVYRVVVPGVPDADLSANSRATVGYNSGSEVSGFAPLTSHVRWRDMMANPYYTTAHCNHCGATFSAPRSARRKYCSLPCAYASRERVRGPQNQRRERGERVCQQCGKRWVPTTRSRHRKFCSKKCSTDSTRKFVDRACKWCGKTFRVRAKDQHVCCSPVCGNAARVAGNKRWRAIPENDERMREAISRWHREKGPGTPMYSNRKAGRREDLENQFFRSSWEANVARYLNFLKDHGQIAKWEYEADTFWFEKIKRGVRSYRPDFKIWDTEDSEPYYWEVKGYDYARGQTARKRMAKYYPHIRVEVIDKDVYQEIKRWKELIPGWEGR